MAKFWAIRCTWKRWSKDGSSRKTSPWGRTSIITQWAVFIKYATFLPFRFSLSTLCLKKFRKILTFGMILILFFIFWKWQIFYDVLFSNKYISVSKKLSNTQGATLLPSKVETYPLLWFKINLGKIGHINRILWGLKCTLPPSNTQWLTEYVILKNPRKVMLLHIKLNISERQY